MFTLGEKSREQLLQKPKTNLKVKSFVSCTFSASCSVGNDSKRSCLTNRTSAAGVRDSGWLRQTNAGGWLPRVIFFFFGNSARCFNYERGSLTAATTTAVSEGTTFQHLVNRRLTLLPALCCLTSPQLSTTKHTRTLAHCSTHSHTHREVR